jgi:hypothetical protein
MLLKRNFNSNRKNSQNSRMAYSEL